jgi:hypothetical protein
VHLSVNRARENKKSVAAVALARRCRPRSDQLHLPVADENIPAVNNSIGKDNRSEKDLVCHKLFRRPAPLNIAAFEGHVGPDQRAAIAAGTLDEHTAQIEPHRAKLPIGKIKSSNDVIILHRALPSCSAARVESTKPVSQPPIKPCHRRM